MSPPPSRIRESATDLEALVDRAAQALGIDAAFVEKDFWVVEALRVATATAASHGLRAVFKGGTSLSKAFAIIERFSEDVDLLLDFPDDMSRPDRDRAIKAIGASVQAHFGIADAKVEQDSARTGVKRNFRLYYPNAKEAIAISEGVYLEIGSRGGPAPSREVPIRSMIAEYAIAVLQLAEDEYEEFAPAVAHVLAPERTLVEKVALLAAAGDKFDGGSLDALAKHGRHVYDIARLLQNSEVLGALAAMGDRGIEDLATDIHVRSVHANWHSVPRPSEGYFGLPIFETGSGSNDALQGAYEAAMPLIYGTRPDFAECMKSIAISEHRL